MIRLIIGVAWLVFLTLKVNGDDEGFSLQQPLTYKEKKQIAGLPTYISTVTSEENSLCQLQYECTRCHIR